MGIASKYNKVVNKFNANTEGFAYFKLSELFEENGADHVYPITSMFISHKGKFGDSAVVSTDECFANFPNHMVETIKDMINDDECVDAINNGKLGFTIYQYTDNTFGKICYAPDFVDIE